MIQADRAVYACNALVVRSPPKVFVDAMRSNVPATKPFFPDSLPANSTQQAISNEGIAKVLLTPPPRRLRLSTAHRRMAAWPNQGH